MLDDAAGRVSRALSNPVRGKSHIAGRGNEGRSESMKDDERRLSPNYCITDTELATFEQLVEESDRVNA